jgi:hypothetical protein
MKRNDFEDATFIVRFKNSYTIVVYNKETDEEFGFKNKEIESMSMEQILQMCHAICW